MPNENGPQPPRPPAALSRRLVIVFDDQGNGQFQVEGPIPLDWMHAAGAELQRLAFTNLAKQHQSRIVVPR